MSRWNYKKGIDFSDRSQFANDVCQLLVDKHNGDFNEAVKHVEPIYNHFEEHVRNVYELIGNEIPLFALYELYKDGSKLNFGFEDSDVGEHSYEACVERVLEACDLYFNKKLVWVDK